MEKEAVMELTMSQSPTSIPMLMSQRVVSNGSETILRTKDRGIWKTVTWSQLDAKVQEIGMALLSADLARGDVVAILSETRPEAVYADLAILGCGAASIAIDPDKEPDRVCHLLSSSGASLAFVENEEQLDKVLAVRDRCPALSRIVLFDMKGLRDFADVGCVSLASFIQPKTSTDWSAAIRAIEPDQPAVIQFARGGSLGQTLTHGDLMHMVSAARARLPIQQNDERLVMLRLSDITERVWGLYLALERDCISNYPEGPDTIIENLRELQPTILGADAAVWGHLQVLATARAKAATATQRIVYEWALQAGRLGGSRGRLADLLVLRSVRREFGLNRLRLAYVGGTPVGPEAMDWARSLGIAIQRVDESAVGTDQADERYQALLQNAYA
jgi:long-chain acyl-CoA synthetase